MGAKPKPARATRSRAPRSRLRGASAAPVPASAATRELLKIVENAPDVMYTHDGEGNLTWANAAAVRCSGYDRNELLKMNVLDLLVPEQTDLVRARWGPRQRGAQLPR